MTSHSYKKYMKTETKKDYNLIKLFIISFCGMLLFFIFIIKSFSPPVDVSIGDYSKEDNSVAESASIDGRLSALQEEDKEKKFSDIMSKATDIEKKEPSQENISAEPVSDNSSEQTTVTTVQPVYKVYIGSYTSSEQAKVARDIIQDTGNGLTPIVKCIGSNNYTLQIGIFKNKTSAEALLYSVQQNHLPGRIVQEF